MKFGQNSEFIKKMVSFVALGSTAMLLSLPTSAQTSEPKPAAQAPGSPTETPGTAPDSTSPAAPLTPTTPAAPSRPGTPAVTPQRPTQTSPASPSGPSAATGTVVDIAAANTSFRTLSRALQEAGLTETLSGQGPFTIFAPTDEAFAALPPGALEALLQPENRETLVQILTYHVVPGRVASSNLQPGAVTTVAGAPVTVQITDGKVRVNDANVVRADIPASNGVIHVIDRVILPPTQSPAQTPGQSPNP